MAFLLKNERIVILMDTVSLAPKILLIVIVEKNKWIGHTAS